MADSLLPTDLLREREILKKGSSFHVERDSVSMAAHLLLGLVAIMVMCAKPEHTDRVTNVSVAM